MSISPDDHVWVTMLLWVLVDDLQGIMMEQTGEQDRTWRQKHCVLGYRQHIQSLVKIELAAVYQIIR